jgi:competence protein ComEC
MTQQTHTRRSGLRLGGRAGVLALVFTLLVSRSVGAEQFEVTRAARLYSGPSTVDTRIRTLQPPEIVSRVSAGETNNYINVRTTRGELGWVYARFLAAVAAPSQPSPTAPGGATPTTGAFGGLPPLRNDQMRSHMINVGQGDSILLEFPCGVALVDTGGESSPDYDSVAPLKAYLDAFFASRPELNSTIELLVLSHPHIDHTRGAAMVSSTYNLANLVDNGQHRTDQGGNPQIDLENWFGEHSDTLKYQAVAAHDVHGSGLTSSIIDPIGSCSGSSIDPGIRALWGQMDPGETGAANPNNNSVVLRVDFGQFSIVLTGDLQEEGIGALLQKYGPSAPVLNADVYKVGHHGSHNATTAELVHALSPQIALISMGPYDRTHGQFIARNFAHPHHDSMALIEPGVSCSRTGEKEEIGRKGAYNQGGAWHPSTWEEQTITAGIFATGWDGNIVVTADKDGAVQVWTERQGFDAGLHCQH